MRINKKYILWMLLSLFFISCEKQEEQIGGKTENYIQIFSQISTRSDNSRVTGNYFETEDKIGVYVIPYAEENVPGDIAQSDYASNVLYRYNAVSWSASSGEDIFWPGTKHADVYGYYPYNSSLTEADPTSYLFTVQNDQQTKSQHMSSDFLWAKVSDLSPTKSVQLIFKHQLSRVQINLRSDDNTITESLGNARVSLTNTIPQGRVDLSDGKVSVNTSSSAVEIKPFKWSNVAEGYTSTFMGIIIPQTIEANTRFIGLQLNSVNYYYRPTTSLTFESGKSYIFNINVSEGGISVVTDVINEWIDGGTIGGEIGEGNKVPRVVNLEEIDWSQSQVHKVYDKNIPIAQVSKEYLFKSGKVDAQAIVVYPLGIDGKPDLTKGFVAQVMNRNRNSTTNEYEPNSSDIHGGSVSFTSANTLDDYKPGSQSLITKVKISSADDIKAATDNSISLLTVKPDLLTDIDGNNYPIVKIGVQYWISENFRAEHYKDGSDLLYYYYNDDASNKQKLGGLYTWDVIMDSRGIAPDTWRVPDDPDWQSLYRYLTPDAGRKLKANIMWSTLGNNNDNVSGFSGLPGGRRTNTGAYGEINNYGQWWCATATSTTAAYRLYLAAGSSAMTYASLDKTYTQSLRLLRDN